jgi:chaperonin GroEL
VQESITIRSPGESSSRVLPPFVVADLVRAKRKNDRNLGYDASTDTYVDMMVAGIIDPALVTMTALKNAASVASTFLSLDAVIVADDSDK